MKGGESVAAERKARELYARTVKTMDVLDWRVWSCDVVRQHSELLEYKEACIVQVSV